MLNKTAPGEQSLAPFLFSLEIPMVASPLLSGEITYNTLPGQLTGGFELADNLHIFTSADGENVELVRAAGQYLRTVSYLEHGFITVDVLDEDGIYRDRYEGRSTTFYARNGAKDCAVRMIDCEAQRLGGVASLPTLERFAIDSRALEQAVGVDRLTDIDPKKTVELSALASMIRHGGEVSELDAVPSLYSIMLRHSLEKGHNTWVFSTHKAMQSALKDLIGEDQLHQIGEPMLHMGSVDTPFVVRPHDVVRKLLGSEDPRYDFHKLYLRRIFEGIDARRIPKDIKNILEANGINYTTPSRMERILSSRRTLGRVGVNGGLIAYTAARAASLSQLSEFHGNVGVFWGLDAAPVPLYVWGLEKTFTGKTTRERAMGAIVSSGAFVAPYAYAYAEGGNYPDYVNAAVGVFVASAVGKEVHKRLSRKRREQELDSKLRATLVA